MKNPLDILVPRPVNSHKGTFGTVKLLCGSEKYTGAAILACSGALRSGCGMVKLCADSLVCFSTRVTLPEVICCHAADFDNIAATSAVIGCGISDRYNKTLENTIKNLNCPAVIDADGINFLSVHKNVLKEAKSDIVITPHPVEFSRISGLDINEISINRVQYAQKFAYEYSCTVVLKGNGTVVAAPNEEAYICPIGSSALSKGGSGDVLAGVIGSLLAQGYSSYTASVIGVYVHALAGEQAKEQFGAHGVLPSDLPQIIGKILG